METDCGHDFENCPFTCTKCKTKIILCTMCMKDRLWQKNTWCKKCNKVKDMFTINQVFTGEDQSIQLNRWLESTMFMNWIIYRIYIVSDRIHVKYFKTKSDAEQYINNKKYIEDSTLFRPTMDENFKLLDSE